MTLITGFRTAEGVVICADSQETLSNPLPNNAWAEYSVRVDKIEPQQIGHYDLVIGGAGDGPLVEGFAEALADQIEIWQAGYNSGTIKEKIRRVVLDYHSHEVALSVALEKDIDFLICLKQKDSPDAEIQFFVIRGTSIQRVQRYALIGWEEGIYRHDIDRHYRDNEKNLFSMLVGVHVLLLAKDTSNHVGGPIKIVVATRDGFRSIAREDAQELEKRVADFDLKLDALRLRVSDTAVPLPDFNHTLSDFQQSVLDLRLSLTGDVLRAKFERLGKVTPSDLSTFYDPYVSTPPFEESLQALGEAWRFFVANRQTKRALVIATSRLAEMVNITVKMISVAFKNETITRAQKDVFATSLVEISKSAEWVIEQQSSGNAETSDQIANIYSHLTEKIVNPLILLMQGWGKLSDTKGEKARRLLQEFLGALLSVFTWFVFSPVSKESAAPEKELQSGSIKQLT